MQRSETVALLLQIAQRSQTLAKQAKSTTTSAATQKQERAERLDKLNVDINKRILGGGEA